MADDRDVIMGRIRRKSGEDVVVRVRLSGGERRVDLRVFRTMAGGDLLAPKDGFSIPKRALPELMRALEAARAHLQPRVRPHAGPSARDAR